MEDAPGNLSYGGPRPGRAVVAKPGVLRSGPSKLSPANSVSMRGHSSSGMRAGVTIGALLGRRRWSRILVTTAGSERNASTRRRVAHFGQTRASAWRERLSWCAHGCANRKLIS